MLHNRSILRAASSLAVAALIAQLLAGCSGATQTLPGFNSAVSAQQNAPASQKSLASRKLVGTIRPDQEDPCSGVRGNVQGPNTFWTESLGPPITWTETTGYYVEEYTDQGIIWSPCPGSTSTTCSPSPTCPGSTYGFHVQVSEAIAPENFKCNPCFLVAEAASNNIGVIAASKKHVVTQVGTLSTTLGSVTYSPVGLAVAKNGTIYASVVSVIGSGFGSSCILVYPPGSTKPTSMLWDSGLGQAVGAIAVDRKDDVFVAYTSTEGSQTSAQIDEFLNGRTKSVPFATIGNAYDGALAVTNEGDVVASSISVGSGGGQIAVLSPKGTIVSSFATTGLPEAISLDNSNKHVWVDDATNNAITEYAFPAGGAPLFSAPLETSGGTPLTPADFLPKDFEKP
jgi:hypothetical protein